MAEQSQKRSRRKKKERIPRQSMPVRLPEVRNKDFDEVPLGYTPEMAQIEAQRCLQCAEPKCVEGCPVHIKIPEFIQLIVDGEFSAAAKKIKENNTLPAVCGRVCPQEEQCEQVCILGKIDMPVAIGRLERFAADYEREHGETEIPAAAPATGKKVAVVGSGPSGLTVAYELLLKGHSVTVFEALHKLGGVLVYGIPEFRLPKKIVASEIETIENMGAEIKLNVLIGKTKTVDQLLDEDGFDAVFLGTGAGLPMFLNLPGESLNGICSANEFLTRVNLMKAYREDYVTPVKVGKKVAVIGAGNVAMDSARSALRVSGGESEVSIIYRRSREEMPARGEEIEHAEEEGIIFNLLTNPVRFIGDEKGYVKAIECVQMELGEPDDSGRRRPIPIEGSEHIVEADTVIVALGTRPRTFISTTTPDLETSRWGTFIAEEGTGATSKPGVFAGGDIVTGSATVILAMGAGREAAKAIDEYLQG
ncbi:MAG: glutamate synthase (NADPH), homotetrameric [Anaerolineaceae bacterium 4572_5.1]|nr:MAG: glutamate synthase (NADPH), homotetrameric [Anaerolineaceae bacterium 4572_5.1]RLD07291.1 MAG: glutamate synthase (NADPH), homotetrameric [Chloroflexota bacterium]